MAIYIPPSIRNFSVEFMCFSTWVDHLAFGYDIVAAARPKLTVELGAQGGLSFFCFCQSLKENEIDGIAYAVDTWEGEEHTGKYDETVFDTVQKQARKKYAGYAYLMRMLFEEATHHFSDESVDLLHIDGLHTYDAVQEDFTTWLPKVRPGGIILFHDIQARMMDFGAWRFWEELSASGEYKTMEFKNGFGLGVLQKKGGAANEHPLLKLLFDSSPEEHAELRAFYIHAGEYLELNRAAERQERITQKRQDKLKAENKKSQQQ